MASPLKQFDPAVRAKPRTARNRVLVTGGAGFVGSHLCDYLVERGDYVRVPRAGPPPPPPPPPPSPPSAPPSPPLAAPRGAFSPPRAR